MSRDFPYFFSDFSNLFLVFLLKKIKIYSNIESIIKKISSELPETKIYDNSQKLGEISEDGTATIRVKKSLTSKTLLAKKTDTNTPQLHFNPRLIQYVYLICLTQLPG